MVFHLEAVLLAVAPPARQPSREVGNRGMRVPLVDERTGDVPGTRVEVLVGAPTRKVASPVVQLQGHVPDRVSKVKAHHTTLLLGGPRDPVKLEELASVVLHSAEHHHRQFLPMLPDRGLDVLGPEGVLSRAGKELHEGGSRVEAMVRDLRVDGKLVRGEGLAFHHDLVALLRRAVESAHEEVQVRREGIHDGDLHRLGAHNPGHVIATIFVGCHPGAGRIHIGKVALNAPSLPLLQLLHDVRPRALGLDTQAVAAEVYAR
mmetsp:Transcript_99357/g.264062  ORF Transcript_99357/g.264062 Transcript_99357/m.264062 type:complete len:261 (-) Transcript_99357:262-1044(-)